ncbi:MAG: hypothetical protein WAT36_03455 [Chromatiaceae bacterium]
MLARLGIALDLGHEHGRFYPQGGGEPQAHPWRCLSGSPTTDQARPPGGLSAVTNLSRD